MSLGVDKSKLKWYQQAELMNGRTAMAAVAGILFPELLASLGMGGPAAANKWFDHASFEYWAPSSTLNMMAFFLSAWVEIRRCVRPRRSLCAGMCLQRGLLFARIVFANKRAFPFAGTWTSRTPDPSTRTPCSPTRC